MSYHVTRFYPHGELRPCTSDRPRKVGGLQVPLRSSSTGSSITKPFSSLENAIQACVELRAWLATLADKSGDPHSNRWLCVVNDAGEPVWYEPHPLHPTEPPPKHANAEMG